MKPIPQKILLTLFFLILLSSPVNGWWTEDPIVLVCVGDSITFGARLENPELDGYPAQLQQLLGPGYLVKNLGVGGCTLIRKGQPTVWNSLAKIREANPDVIVISLGTNDTCGEGTCGNRKCWEYRDEYHRDYWDLIDSLRAMPSHPEIWICAPSPMVLETPGLSPARQEGLSIRKPRLQKLVATVKEVAKEKKTGFIDLNTPLDHKPELFTVTDGVHPNKAGYRAIAELVHQALNKEEDPGKSLDASAYHNLRGGLRNSLHQFEQEKQGRIAFLGGSITYNGGWRDSLMSYFQSRFPETEFDFVAAGIPSMGSTPSAFRLERDVLSKGRIDLLFVEAAVNDASNGRTNTEQQRAMEGIVRHVRASNSATDVVMMHFVDPRKMESYRIGQEPAVIRNHNKVADHYGIPTINLAKEVTQRIDHGEFTWEEDFKNLHPSPFGQGIYAASMIQFLNNAFSETEDDNVSPHPSPAKLDPFCYDNGTLIDITTIKRTKDWEIDPNWQPTDGTGTRANYTQVPMLIGQTPGKKIKLSFQGNAVGIAIAAGQDAGMIEYRIDKQEWQQQNLFTKWSKGLHLPWYYTLASGLSSGKHLLEVRISSEKDERSNGNACRIRYVFINQQSGE